MKFTQERLRDLYLKDLNEPDTFHGRTRPKARNIRPWKAIRSTYAEGIAEYPLDPISDPKRIFVWSDIHFGHKNIIKYTGRPFINADAMNEGLISAYKANVTDGDIVIFGGDIGFMKVPAINAILDDLPGYKILIYGNHDIDRRGGLYDLHFDERHLCKVIDITDGQLEYQLLFTHYPLDPKNVPVGCYNIHGHIHDNLIPGTQHINICVEHTAYKPVLIWDHVIARTHAHERQRLRLT